MAEATTQSSDEQKVSTVETVEKPIEHYDETERLIYRAESARVAEATTQSSGERKASTVETVEKPIERYSETERLIYRTERESSAETREVGLLTMNSYFGEGARYLSQTAERHIHRSFTLEPTLRETLVRAESRSDTFTSLTKAVKLLTSEKAPSAHDRKLTERAVELVLRREGEKSVTLREFRELDRERRTQVLTELTRLIAADVKKGKRAKSKTPPGMTGNEAAVLAVLNADKAGEAGKVLAGSDTVLLRQLSRIYETASHTAATNIYNQITSNVINTAGVPETGYSGTSAARIYRVAAERPAERDSRRERPVTVTLRQAADRIYERTALLYGRNITNLYTMNTTSAGSAPGYTAAPQYDTATLTERPSMPRMYPGSVSEGRDIRITAGTYTRKPADITNRYDIRHSADTVNMFLTLRGTEMTNNAAQSATAAEAQPFTDIRYLPLRREAAGRNAPAQPSAVSAEELVSRFGNLIEGADAGLSQAGIVHVSGDISRGVREAVAKVAVTEEKVAENSKLISDIRRRQTEMEEQVLRRSDIDELSESFIGKLRAQLRYEKSRYSS